MTPEEGDHLLGGLPTEPTQQTMEIKEDYQCLAEAPSCATWTLLASNRVLSKWKIKKKNLTFNSYHNNDTPVCIDIDGV